MNVVAKPGWRKKSALTPPPTQMCTCIIFSQIELTVSGDSLAITINNWISPVGNLNNYKRDGQKLQTSLSREQASAHRARVFSNCIWRRARARFLINGDCSWSGGVCGNRGAIVCLIIYAGRNQLSIANWPPSPMAPVAPPNRSSSCADTCPPNRSLQTWADLHITPTPVTPLCCRPQRLFAAHVA